MPVYTFEIAPFLAGRSVTVRDASGASVASGTLDENAKFTATLAVGDYVASASDGNYTYKAAGVVDQGDPDRLADSSLSSTYALKGDVAGSIDKGETIAARLDTGSGDMTLALLGDSTGNDSNEWLRLALAQMGADNPSLRIEYALWSDASQAYPAPAVLQAGASTATAGTQTARDTFTRTSAELTGTTGETGAAWAGTSGTWKVNGTAAEVTGQGRVVTGTSGQTGNMIATAKGVTMSTVGGASDRSLRVVVKYVGVNDYVFAYVTAAATTGAVSWGVYKRIAGVNTQIATGLSTVLPAGATTTFDMSVSVEGTTVTATCNGQTISGSLTSSDATALSTSYRGGLESAGAATVGVTVDEFTLALLDGATATAQKLMVYNGSMPGSTLAYQSARLSAMLPVAPDLTVISSCHNYNGTAAASYVSTVADVVSAVRALHPNTGIAVSSQNPEKDPSTFVAAHLSRLTELRVKAKRAGWGYVPVVEKFLAQSDNGASWVNSDGIHPTTGTGSGSEAWRDVFLAYLDSLSLKPAA